MGPVGGGVGAPSVTWVLDESMVVGDNNRDRVSPVGWERGRVSVRRPSSMGGVLAGTPVAGADRGLTLMWRWAVPTAAAGGEVQAGMA
jgi:hypothetical protein